MFIITEKSELFKRYLNTGLTELDTKCSPPFSPSAFASTKLTKNDAKHILKISVRLSVNNVLTKNWSTFRQMQTLDKVTNFSLNCGIKMFLLFCSLHLVLRLEAGHFPSLLPYKFHPFTSSSSTTFS